ncbi:MAG: histidine phosphatase family protein [Candidatus Obscuribacterales bacterium]|nr:histidine phosphatase family protein [Steroidobacteraceae bacterium]
MKRLTLVRHAQADNAMAGQSDFERLLTRRGTQDATEMARRIKQTKMMPELIIASAAPRAYSTATLFGNTLHLEAEQIQKEERLYTATVNESLAIVQAADDCNHLMIVAHNPTITEFADKLSGERNIDAMPTCGVVTMQFKIKKWAELRWDSGIDVELDYPGKSP